MEYRKGATVFRSAMQRPHVTPQRPNPVTRNPVTPRRLTDWYSPPVSLSQRVVFFGHRVVCEDGVVAGGGEFLQVGGGVLELLFGGVVLGGKGVEFCDGIVAGGGEGLDLDARLGQFLVANAHRGGPLIHAGFELVALGAELLDLLGGGGELDSFGPLRACRAVLVRAVGCPVH